MQNLKPVKNPHEHFASFWKSANPNTQQHLADLNADMRRAVEHLINDTAFPRCATVEVPTSLLAEGLEGKIISQDVSQEDNLQICWLVGGDLVEVALIACEMVKAQQSHEREEEKKLEERMAQLYMEREDHHDT